MRTLTAARAFPLLDAVSAFDAELYVEGHTDTVMPRAEAVGLLGEIRSAGELAAGPWWTGAPSTRLPRSRPRARTSAPNRASCRRISSAPSSQATAPKLTNGMSG